MDIHISLFFYTIFSLLIATLVHLITFVLVLKKYFYDKFSVYECGFAPYNDALVLTDIHFYLVAILFIIFDVELVYFLPWTLTIHLLNILGSINFIIFVIILVLGFGYEFMTKSLEW